MSFHPSRGVRETDRNMGSDSDSVQKIGRAVRHRRSPK